MVLVVWFDRESQTRIPLKGCGGLPHRQIVRSPQVGVPDLLEAFRRVIYANRVVAALPESPTPRAGNLKP